MATPLPPYPQTEVISDRNGTMSLPMRQNDEDIKRKIAELEALVTDQAATIADQAATLADHEARIYALENP